MIEKCVLIAGGNQNGPFRRLEIELTAYSDAHIVEMLRSALKSLSIPFESEETLRIEELENKLAKMAERRDRWRKRAEDAERALEGALKVNDMYVGMHNEMQKACAEIERLRAELEQVKGERDFAGKSFGAVARKVAIDTAAAFDRAISEADGLRRERDEALAECAALRAKFETLECEEARGDAWKHVADQQQVALTKIARERDEARAQLAERTREREEITALHNRTQELQQKQCAQDRFNVTAEAAKSGDPQALRDFAKAAEAMLAESRESDAQKVRMLQSKFDAIHRQTTLEMAVALLRHDVDNLQRAIIAKPKPE